ncbi:MAG TPA: hypothetical protein VFS20_06835 [Longimicrobium sp.]|nr:hypothetical protein [Longimicrobium sp.]
MASPDAGSSATVILVDTNVIIEAVRTRVWKALLGNRKVETVQECRDETQRGSPHDPGYVVVNAADLAGLSGVHAVTDLERATLALSYADASALDAGERDLLAHALARHARGDSVWVVSSPDRACVRVAVALGLADHTISLEELTSESVRRCG